MSVSKKVAVVGQGVIGCSTALCFLEKFPSAQITVFGCHDFKNTCSYGPAGLFRFDKYEDKKWAEVSFERFAFLEREFGPKTGIKLISGHIQSDNRQSLEGQEKNYADIVYNFRWLTDRGDFNDVRQPVEVHNDGYQFVFNCAGLNGGKLAEDDDSVVPCRGVIMEVEAPWQHHFNYRDFTTFTIPMSNSVALGTLKQLGRTEMEITDEDRKEIWQRYLKLHPQFKEAKVLSEWIALRPEREHVRLEHQERTSATGSQYHVVHNYGHSGAGISLSYGCAVEAVKIMGTNL